jgi:ATP phosphoribosyltransferase
LPFTRLQLIVLAQLFYLMAVDVPGHVGQGVATLGSTVRSDLLNEEHIKRITQNKSVLFNYWL